MLEYEKERASGFMCLEFTVEWYPDDYEKKPTKKQMLAEVKRDFKEFRNVGNFYYPKFKLKVEEVLDE